MIFTSGGKHDFYCIVGVQILHLCTVGAVNIPQYISRINKTIGTVPVKSSKN